MEVLSFPQTNYSWLPCVKESVSNTYFPAKLTVAVSWEYYYLDECFGTIRKDDKSESSSILNLPGVRYAVLIRKIWLTCVPAAAWGIGITCEVWVWETVCVGVAPVETDGCCSWYCPGCWEEAGCWAFYSREKMQKLFVTPHRGSFKSLSI